MPLAPERFKRRFLLHVLTSGFQCIWHDGLLVHTHRREWADRRATGQPAPEAAGAQIEKTGRGGTEPVRPTFVCIRCGAATPIVETFTRGQSERAPHQRGPS